MFLILILNSSPFKGYSQINYEYKIEEIALKYFCENVLPNEPSINKLKIGFSGYTNGKPSQIYDVANCLRDIDLLKDSIPNENLLDSLESMYTKNQYNIIKVMPKCKRLSKISASSKFDYRLFLYNAIMYKNNYQVEIYLVSKTSNTITIIISLDKVMTPINYCIKFISY